MSALLDTPRDQEISSRGLARLLADIEPAPFEQQARTFRHLKASGAHLEDDLVRELVRVGSGPIAGHALGGETGAAFMNHPSSDPWKIAPAVFEEATVKHVWSSAGQDYRGFAQRQAGFDIPSFGLLAEIELAFAGTYTRTDGGGSHTVTDYSPYGMAEEIELNVDGEALKQAHGLAYEFRRQVVTRKGTAVPDVSPTAAGANTWDVRWRIPVADNMRNLWGAIYAQGDDLDVRLEIMNAPQATIVTLAGGATVTLTGTYTPTWIAYDAPWVNIKGVGLVIVLPDTDVLHRFHQFQMAGTPQTGENTLKLQKTAGEVERVYLFLDNASSTLMDPSSWSEVRFRYLSTKEPQKWTGKNLLGENARVYSNKITPKCAVIDNSAHNQRRDALFPNAVVDPEVVVEIPSSVTINAGARLYGVQESLVGGP